MGKEIKNTFIEGAFGALWKDHTGRGMGESMGMRSDTGRAGSLRVASKLGWQQAQGESGSIMDRIKTSRLPLLFLLRIDIFRRKAGEHTSLRLRHW